VGRCCHDFLHTSTDGITGPLASCSVCSCTLLPVARVSSRKSTFRRGPGESFPVEYTASTTVSTTGEHTGVVVTFRDITERQAVDAPDLVQQAVDVMQPMAERAGIDLRAEADHCSLRVDADRILQTLMNLLSNAIKFSPRGAKVTVSAASEGETFTFHVTDEGRGIPRDKLETVFERFQQVD